MPQHPFVARLTDDWPSSRWSDVTVVIAVSGGADSVALTRAMHSLASDNSGRIVLAHFNHRWRGDESDEDEQFVRQLGSELALSTYVERAVECSRTSEESARRQRYRFLHRLALQLGARYIATAHTADDQLETILFRILRGTGLRGLAGIPRVRRLSEAVTVVRPLLDQTRAQMRKYLEDLKQPWREDRSNTSLKFARNRIRHELLPLLEEQYHPAVRQSLRRLTRLAGRADRLIRRLAAQQIGRSLEAVDESAVRLHLHRRQPQLVRCEMLRQVWQMQGWPQGGMAERHWRRLAALPGQPPQVHTLPGAIRAQWDGSQLWLSRQASERPAATPPGPAHLQ